MLRRLKQLRKGGTEARNRRRQQSPLIFLIIRWSCKVWCLILNWRFVLMNSTSYTVIPYRHAFYKKLESRSIFIHHITMHYFTLQCTVIYLCWTETFHLITFGFFWQLLTTATTARVSTMGLATIFKMAFVVIVLKALSG